MQPVKKPTLSRLSNMIEEGVDITRIRLFDDADDDDDFPPAQLIAVNEDEDDEDDEDFPPVPLIAVECYQPYIQSGPVRSTCMDSIQLNADRKNAIDKDLEFLEFDPNQVLHQNI